MSANLKQWISAHNGAFIGSIEAYDFPDTGRGIRATKELNPGELTLAVPERLLMHAGSAARCTALQAAFRNTKTLPQSEEELLALHLLCEVQKGPSSFWAPYLAVLPHHYTTLACFCARAASHLQAPHAVHAATRSRATFEKSLARIRPVLHQLGIIDPHAQSAQWLHAVATCSSRTMYMPNSSAGTLTPLGDLHNYTPPPPPHVPELKNLCCGGRRTIAGWTWVHALDETQGTQEYSKEPDGSFDDKHGLYRIVAPQRYAAGEQVFLCYGKYDNLQLLEHYGFVLNPNPHDCIPLSIPMGATITLHCNGVPTWEGLRDLRLAALPRSKHPRSAHLARYGTSISRENDIAALNMLNQAALEALEALPTSLRDDLELLEKRSASMAVCERLALQWRVMYKRALYWASMLYINDG